MPCYFNSHARVGRDTTTTIFSPAGMDNFNSHARVGRDKTVKPTAAKAAISTHTPV